MLVVAKDLQNSLRKGAGFRIEKALAHATRKAINEVLARDHPEIFVRIEPTVWQKPWWPTPGLAGRGGIALRYLAAYVKKSAFSEGRLLDYDQSGRIVLSYRDSADGKLRSEALDPLELIRRWLLDSFAPAQSGLRPCTACGLSRSPPGGLRSTSLRRPTPVCLRTDVSHPKKPKRCPRQREIAKETVDGLSRFLQSRSKLVDTALPPKTKLGRRRSGPGPENQIPIPRRYGILTLGRHKSIVVGS